MARGRPSKKQHIIDTALSLFSRMGYQGTSIDQVVTAAEVSKPTVYSNFSSKQILWRHSLEQVLQLATQDLVAFAASQKVSNQKTSASLSLALDQWLSLWSLWLDDEYRMCVYRIMLGESHKMEADSIALFQQLENLLADHLLESIRSMSFSEEQKSVLLSVTKARLLLPKLYGQLNYSAHFPWFNNEPNTDIKATLTSLMS